MAKQREDFPGPEYHVSIEIGAPLRYVFAWCTDFRPGDDRLEKDRYTRKILHRSRRQVVFEDLSDAGKGWSLSRHVVDLYSPTRWHSESVGSHRVLTLDYTLTPLSTARTRFDLHWRRRPTALGSKPPSRAMVEKSTTQAWRNFAHALESDYRKNRKRTRT